MPSCCCIVNHYQQPLDCHGIRKRIYYYWWGIAGPPFLLHSTRKRFIYLYIHFSSTKLNADSKKALNSKWTRSTRTSRNWTIVDLGEDCPPALAFDLAVSRSGGTHEEGHSGLRAAREAQPQFAVHSQQQQPQIAGSYLVYRSIQALNP